MKKCTFSELSQKEVINSCDCRRLGYVIDCTIDLDCGTIINIIVGKQTSILCFGKQQDNIFTIPYECIKKIGDDIILTDIVCPSLPPKPRRDSKDKKFFFSE